MEIEAVNHTGKEIIRPMPESKISNALFNKYPPYFDTANTT